MKKLVLFFCFLCSGAQAAEFFPQKSTNVDSPESYLSARMWSLSIQTVSDTIVSNSALTNLEKRVSELQKLREAFGQNSNKIHFSIEEIDQWISSQKKISNLFQPQEPPTVILHILDQATYKNVSVFISLTQQRVYLKVGDKIAIDSPLCSGKVANMTPQGQFTILEKDSDHRSNVYGKFINKNGAIVRGVNLKSHSAPSGTIYVGAPMKWFMRLNWQGVGMHAGILRGYPASHGCIRLPEDIAKIIYNSVKVGTPVVIAK